MFLKSKMRLLGMSALVGAGLLGTGPALAYTVNLGGVDVQIDSTMSVGSTWQIKDSDSRFLPETNGGNPENNPIFDFVRTEAGALKYYDKTLLDADGAPKYLSKTLAVREEANITIGLTNDLAAGTRVVDTGSGAAVPKGGVTVLDYLNPNNCTPAYGGSCQSAPAALAYNFDGSINTDDGRLSFSKGDAVSAPVKIVTDIELSQGSVKGFFRVKGFYDAVLMDENNFKRGADFTDDGEELTGAGIDLLDAYVSYDFDLGDMPATMRVGKQVINWGEATFIPGGNSAFNPIDVPAIRRPGAELKEAFLPVEALYGSIALTDTISVEAYVGGWDRYKLDVGGTFFAGSDSAEPGNNSGNPSDLFYVGGGPNSGTQWACDNAALTAAYPAAGVLAAAIDTASSKDPCAGSAAADILVPYTVGSTESERLAIDPTDGIDRLSDDEGDDSIGLAVRWYAENLNSTEFGFYYQKMDSRLPYVSYKSMPTQVKGAIAGGDASQVSRGAGLTGCFAAYSGGVSALFGNVVDPKADFVTKLDFATAYYRPSSGDVAIADPDGLIEAYGAAVVGPAVLGSPSGVNAYLSTMGSSGVLGGLFINAAATAAIKAEMQADAEAADATYAAPIVNFSQSLQYAANTAAENTAQFGAGVVVYGSAADLIAAQDTANGDTVWADAVTATNNAVDAYVGTTDMGDGAAGTVAGMQQANCAGTINQAFGNLATNGGHPFDTFGQVKSGAVSLGYTQNIALYLEHPEVETYGFSFNTVLGGWGVQGDFSFRPDAPLQIDTDVLTINALFQNGAALGAGAAEASYTGLEGYNGEFIGNPYSYQAGEQTIKGYVEHDVITWDIGTTATFTRSNPVIAAIGADIGILLTEFQGLIVDGAEDRANPTQNLNIVPLSNVCTSGSDLALNSVLNIDQRATNGMCRPTDESSGAVILARATWNNVLGTPISMSPTVVFREGLEGYSPSPMGSWREGVGSTAASVGFDYLGKMGGSLSYVTYHGDDLRTKNGDRDHVSLSLTYSY